MLSVQVQYAQHLENQRHNKEMERIQTNTLSETVRHDKVLEDQGFKNLQEVNRHNLISESQQDRQIAINQGHLNLGRDTLDETIRHNLITEENALKQAQASLTQARAAMKNAETNAQRAIAQNSLDAATENLRNLQSLQTHFNNKLIEAQTTAQEEQARYYQIQSDFYDTQLMMRAIQSVSGAMTPFMIGGK